MVKKSWMMLNFGVKQYKRSGLYEIEMNFVYVLCRKCMQNLQEAAGAALVHLPL